MYSITNQTDNRKNIQILQNGPYNEIIGKDTISLTAIIMKISKINIPFIKNNSCYISSIAYYKRVNIENFFYKVGNG